MTVPGGTQQPSDWPAGLLGPVNPDVLPAVPPPGAGPVRKALLVGAAGLATAAVAGTAWATVSFLSGGGVQPEDVLPAGTLAMAKIDLDPAAGQKVAVYRLAQRFPSTSDDVSGADAVKDELLRALFEDVPELDYARDVEPWIGDRAAVAAVPVAGAAPEPLLAVAFTDRGAASDALTRLAAASPEDPLHHAFSRRADYVLIGATQQVVDDAADASDVLGGQERYASAVDELDGDQLVTAWADLDAVWQAIPEEDRTAATGAGQLQPTGRVVVGGRAVDEGIEVVGRALALRTGSAQEAMLGREPGTGMVAALPAGTVAAIGATGIGDAAVELYEQLAATGDPLGLSGASEALGLQLPDDLRVVLGQEMVVAAFGDEEFAGRSRTEDPERAGTLVEQLLTGAFGFGAGLEEQYYVDEGYGSLPPAEAIPPSSPDLLPPEELVVEEGEVTSGSIGFRGQEQPPDMVRVLDDGVAVGSGPAALDKISGTDGGLGRSPQFGRAVPDADGAGAVLFVDIARALETFGAGMPAEDRADLEVLEAFGATSTGGENGTFRLRLTVR